MTLVVGAQNNAYALQVSDRRLTGPDGSVVDDESNKLFILESDACRFVVGFSGLAGDGGRFKTNEWLPEALRDSAPPDYKPDGLIERLRVEATRKFATPAIHRLTPTARRTSVMLTGFEYMTDGPRLSYGMITNFQDYERGGDDVDPWPEFRAWWRILSYDQFATQWAVQRIGAWDKFATPQVEAVKDLVASGRPPSAVVGKTVELIRDISGLPGSTSTVGRQLMSAVLPVDRTQPSTFAYHSDEEQMTYHTPTIVFARSDIGGAIFRGATLTSAGPDAKPIIYPKQSRNQLCKCGSGKKYKKCHGAN